jgi:hypothetical protein
MPSAVLDSKHFFIRYLWLEEKAPNLLSTLNHFKRLHTFQLSQE